MCEGVRMCEGGRWGGVVEVVRASEKVWEVKVLMCIRFQSV